MASTELELRGLVLSAAEIKQLTGWTDPMVEDYLNILENLITLAGSIDANEDTYLGSEADLQAGMGRLSAKLNQSDSAIRDMGQKIGDFLAMHGMIFSRLNAQSRRIDDLEQLHYAE